MDATSLATFWALVALIIFLALIAYLGVPGKIGKALDDKTKEIEGELAEAKRLREEAQALLADYKAKAADAEREAAQIVVDAKAQAERLTEETNKSLEETIARRTRAAEAKISQAETQAIAEVRARATDIAVAAAEKLLVAKVPGATAAGLIDDGIATVRAKLN